MEIKFKDVSYSYKKVNYTEKEVLKNVNVTFKKWEINCLIGKSGVGKTTLLELIDGILIPTNGSIEIDSFKIEANKKTDFIDELRFNIGMVPQFPEEQFFNSTVKKELELPLKFFNYKLDQIDKRVNDVIKMVGLDQSYLSLNPFKLSNGEKRKVAIASCLITNPKVLLLDEPTIGLDSKSKNDLIKLLRLLKKRYNKTIIIVSHDIDFLHKIADHVYVLSDYNIVLEGDKYSVFKDEKRLKKYGIASPKIIQISNKILDKKKIKIGYRDEINDLIKDIYRYVK